MERILGKNVVSSLYGVAIIPQRRCGNTTRIVDNAIQKLFEGKEVLCLDHTNMGNEHRRLAHLILQRLKDEHQSTTKPIWNKSDNTIKLA
jgi:hypothetical protein